MADLLAEQGIVLNQTESNVTNAEINTYKAVDELQTVRVAPLRYFFVTKEDCVGRRISAKLEDKNTYTCCMLSRRASCSGWRRGWIFGLRVHEINPSPITTYLVSGHCFGGGGEREGKVKPVLRYVCLLLQQPI